jgi:hypothetical protein
VWLEKEENRHEKREGTKRNGNKTDEDIHALKAEERSETKIG